MKMLTLNLFAQTLNLLAINGRTTQNHFEPVVIWRIMTTRNHDSGFGLDATQSLISSKVNHGGSHHAQINHIDAG